MVRNLKLGGALTLPIIRLSVRVFKGNREYVICDRNREWIRGYLQGSGLGVDMMLDDQDQEFPILEL